MEAVEETLQELKCPGSLNMDLAIIKGWIEGQTDDHQQRCVELATLESSVEEAEERDLELQEELHHLQVTQAIAERMLLDLRVHSMVSVLNRSTL